MAKVRKNIFMRFINFLLGKAHSAMDQIEDSISLLEDKISELQTGYVKAIEGLSRVSALEIKFKGKAKSLKDSADAYRKKAEQLKAKMESEEITEAEGRKHIIVMLNKEEQLLTESKNMKAQATAQGQVTKQLEDKIKKMKKLIDDSNNQVSILKVQKETAEVNKSVSKELSSVNLDGISAHIEGLEDEINSNNAEAEAWSNMDDTLATDEERIDKILNEPSKTEDSVLLNNFLKK